MSQSLDFNDKITYYEQMYFTYDKPVPFKPNLNIYPVKIKDYFLFYSLINCFTVDKLSDPNPECLGFSDLDYVFYLMQNPLTGESFKNQFLSLLELVFHIKNGMVCANPECKHHECKTFDEIYDELCKLKEESKDYDDSEEYFSNKRKEYLNALKTCPHCGCDKRDLIYITKDEKTKKLNLYIGDHIIKRQDYNDLKRVYCYQNLPDYNDDYIDPELKEALDEANKLRNKNAEQPTLEKQKACIVASSSYKYDELDELTIRKFILLLRTIDGKMSYQICKQGEASGLVSFKGEIEHWIYSNNNVRKNRFKNIMSVDQVESKIGQKSRAI